MSVRSKPAIIPEPLRYTAFQNTICATRGNMNTAIEHSTLKRCSILV